jgi:hypothetical protein
MIRNRRKPTPSLGAIHVVPMLGAFIVPKFMLALLVVGTVVFLGFILRWSYLDSK